MILLAACSGDAAPTPAPQVRATNTPISTPLPVVATAIPAGLPDNPLRMVIAPADAERAAEYVDAFEASILEASNVTVTIDLVEDVTAVMAAICDDRGEVVSAGWLGGLNFAAAAASGCGTAVLQTQAADGSTGFSGQIIVRRVLGTTDLTGLRSRTYCRVSLDDLYSWLLPSLVFRARGIDPADFATVIEHEDYDALVTAVAEGVCDGAGVPAAYMDALAGAEDSRLDDIRVAFTSVDFPHLVLMYPVGVPVAARISLTDGLLDLATELVTGTQDEDPTDDETITAGEEPGIADADESIEADSNDAFEEAGDNPTSGDDDNFFRTFFDAEGVMRVEEDTFNALEAFLNQTGLDLQRLGE